MVLFFVTRSRIDRAERCSRSVRPGGLSCRIRH
jgi:hypothetical protein